MIDLDPALQQWLGATPWESPLPGWTRTGAAARLKALATAHNLTLTAYEPPEEEWVCVRAHDATAIASTLFPLAFVTVGLDEVVCRWLPGLTVLPLASMVAADYRASPELLRATLLRFGWTNDFSSEGFCVSDLVVESVEGALTAW
ncbi:hypothetical protein [Actinopolymorpha alba]|uniref:hypothetical protein n=1 Tax=Actinopolymorpha alba TaxID=533267 RepID=UPI0003A7321F|nr:hypothetical protein [Actinopolymorpha alba]